MIHFIFAAIDYCLFAFQISFSCFLSMSFWFSLMISSSSTPFSSFISAIISCFSSFTFIFKHCFSRQFHFHFHYFRLYFSIFTLLFSIFVFSLSFALTIFFHCRDYFDYFARYWCITFTFSLPFWYAAALRAMLDDALLLPLLIFFACSFMFRCLFCFHLFIFDYFAIIFDIFFIYRALLFLMMSLMLIDFFLIFHAISIRFHYYIIIIDIGWLLFSYYAIIYHFLHFFH